MPKNFSAWPEGYPRTMDYPELPVFEILNQTAHRTPGRTALVFDQLELTFVDLHELAGRFASALIALGISKGDRVAVHLPNCSTIQNRKGASTASNWPTAERLHCRYPC